MNKSTSQPVRVLVLSTTMGRGGAEAFIMNNFRNFDRDKVVFDFLEHRDENADYDDEIRSLGGKIYHVPPIVPGKFGAYKKAVDEFFTNHPQYKIIHANMSENACLAFRVAKKHNIPVRICHSHNVPSFANVPIKEKLKYLMRLKWRKDITKYSTDYFACGEEAGMWLYGQKKKNEIKIIKNAIDTQQFIYNKGIREKIRKEYNIEDKFVIGHVGRFFPQKNHTFLVDIFEEIKKKNPKAVLMLVGQGELKESIEKKVAEKGLTDSVIFTGLVTNVNEIAQAFDAFCMPSLYEGLSVAMVEMQATGVRSIISDTVPPECIITDNVDIVPLNASPIQWAEAVLKFDDGREKPDMSQVIKEKGFDIKENALWLQNFYLNKNNEINQ